MTVTAIRPNEADRMVAVSADLATDVHLVASVRLGDDRAFEVLYERYHRRIAAYVYGMVNDYGRAEDITQEVFISALRRMRETERPIAFKPWVYEIAKNACIDQFRRSKRAEEISYDADDGLGSADYGRLVTTGPSPEAAVDAKQQLAHLCGAFGGLSETHHQILVLRELEGLSYREIGEKMGLSRPSVESTLFRARRRLSEEYDELVSGQRCVRIQSIITTTSTGMLGTRDSRRVARHIAHCQPCRRQAVSSGLDTATLAPKTVRERIGAKVAALVPLPFLRRRGPDEVASLGQTSQIAGQVALYAEPIMTGWSKAAAAAATLVIAGGVAGVGSQMSSQSLGEHEGRGSGSSTAPASRSERRESVQRNGARSLPSLPAGKRRSKLALPGAGTGGGPTGTMIEGQPDPVEVSPTEQLPPEVRDPAEEIAPDPGKDPKESANGYLDDTGEVVTSANGDAGSAYKDLRSRVDEAGGDGGGGGEIL